jgi:hypothetical protein
MSLRPRHVADEPGFLFSFAILIAFVAFWVTPFVPSCTARDRRAIRTIADIADETCKDIQAPRDCLHAIATNPKFAKAEAEAPAPSSPIQVFCGPVSPALSVSAPVQSK